MSGFWGASCWNVEAIAPVFHLRNSKQSVFPSNGVNYFFFLVVFFVVDFFEVVDFLPALM